MHALTHARTHARVRCVDCTSFSNGDDAIRRQRRTGSGERTNDVCYHNEMSAERMHTLRRPPRECAIGARTCWRREALQSPPLDQSQRTTCYHRTELPVDGERPRCARIRRTELSAATRTAVVIFEKTRSAMERAQARHS
jgi:hypothetical protein